jgi:hypothetical protein
VRSAFKTIRRNTNARSFAALDKPSISFLINTLAAVLDLGD